MSLCVKKRGQCSWEREWGGAGDGAESSAGMGLVEVISHSFVAKDIWRALCLKQNGFLTCRTSQSL